MSKKKKFHRKPANDQIADDPIVIATEDIAELYAEACEIAPPPKPHSTDDQRLQYAKEIADRA